MFLLNLPEAQKINQQAIANFCGVVSCDCYINNTCPFDPGVQAMTASSEQCDSGVLLGKPVVFYTEPHTGRLRFRSR